MSWTLFWQLVILVPWTAIWFSLFLFMALRPEEES